MMGLGVEEWLLVALLPVAMGLVAWGAYTAGGAPLPRRPLPHPRRRYPRHALWTTERGTARLSADRLRRAGGGGWALHPERRRV